MVTTHLKWLWILLFAPIKLSSCASIGVCNLTDANRHIHHYPLITQSNFSLSTVEERKCYTPVYSSIMKFNTVLSSYDHITSKQLIIKPQLLANGSLARSWGWPQHWPCPSPVAWAGPAATNGSITRSSLHSSAGSGWWTTFWSSPGLMGMSEAKYSEDNWTLKKGRAQYHHLGWVTGIIFLFSREFSRFQNITQ